MGGAVVTVETASSSDNFPFGWGSVFANTEETSRKNPGRINRALEIKNAMENSNLSTFLSPCFCLLR
jgi:hypothetical protein